MNAPIKKSEAKYGIVTASKIIGEAAINRQNENLGKIHELVIDAQDGRLAYAVLSSAASCAWGTSCSHALEGIRIRQD